MEEKDIIEIQDNVDMIPETPEDNVVFTMVANLISDCWKTIDSYNGVLASIKDLGNQEAIDKITELLNDEIDKVSQLESILKEDNTMIESMETTLGSALTMTEKEDIKDKWKEFSENPDNYKNTAIADTIKNYLKNKRNKNMPAEENEKVEQQSTTPAQKNSVTEDVSKDNAKYKVEECEDSFCVYEGENLIASGFETKEDAQDFVDTLNDTGAMSKSLFESKKTKKRHLHLSESLRSSQEQDDFIRDVYDALAEVMFKWCRGVRNTNNCPSEGDMDVAYAFFESHFWDSDD